MRARKITAMIVTQTKDGTKKEEIMKRINTTLIMTAAIILAASCEQMPENNDIRPAELTPMTFTAGVDSDIQVEDTKTTYSGRKVYWEAEDSISVFFIGDQITKQKFTATALYEDNTVASFEGLGDEDATSYVAVYPHSDANAYDGTNLTVNIPSVQVGVAQGFASGANTSIAYSSNGKLTFRNACALIAFRFETPAGAAQTASVTFKAKTAESGKYYGLTGTSTVTLQDELPVAGEGSADYVTVMAPEGGFECGSNKVYYVAVYPGQVNGFEVTFTTNDTTPITSVLNNDTPATLKRNYLLSFGLIPNAYDTLPEEFSITLFEQGWTFNEKIIPTANQSTSGSGDKYTYTYEYKFGDVTYTKDLNFYIYGGGEGYTYTFNYYSSSNNYQFRTAQGSKPRIYLPGIKGRYIKSVQMKVNNTSAKKMELLGAADWEVRTGQVGATLSSPGFFSAPEDYAPEYNTPYYLRIVDGNAQITAVTVTYAKNTAATE